MKISVSHNRLKMRGIRSAWFSVLGGYRRGIAMYLPLVSCIVLWGGIKATMQNVWTGR